MKGSEAIGDSCDKVGRVAALLAHGQRGVAVSEARLAMLRQQLFHRTLRHAQSIVKRREDQVAILRQQKAKLAAAVSAQIDSSHHNVNVNVNGEDAETKVLLQRLRLLAERRAAIAADYATVDAAIAAKEDALAAAQQQQQQLAHDTAVFCQSADEEERLADLIVQEEAKMQAGCAEKSNEIAQRHDETHARRQRRADAEADEKLQLEQQVAVLQQQTVLIAAEIERVNDSHRRQQQLLAEKERLVAAAAVAEGEQMDECYRLKNDAFVLLAATWQAGIADEEERRCLTLLLRELYDDEEELSPLPNDNNNNNNSGNNESVRLAPLARDGIDIDKFARREQLDPTKLSAAVDRLVSLSIVLRNGSVVSLPILLPLK